MAVFCASLALAAGAAHWYETPRLNGVAEQSLWLEPDVLCAVLASASALALGVLTRRWATQPGAIAAGSALLRGALWVLLSVVFLGVWGHYLSLLALLVAPSQAFAALRVLALLSSWRSELR